MMKAYVKPELFYERYELSQHIADCAWEMQLANKDNCVADPDPAKLPGMPTLFTSKLNCTLTEDNYEGYCYMPGPDGINTFIS